MAPPSAGVRGQALALLDRLRGPIEALCRGGLATSVPATASGAAGAQLQPAWNGPASGSADGSANGPASGSAGSRVLGRVGSELAAVASELAPLLPVIVRARERAARPRAVPAGASAEPPRLLRLQGSLERFAVEVAGLGGQPPTEQQRLLAAGLRLCAALGMELLPSGQAPRSRPIGPAAAPIAAPAAATAAAPIPGPGAHPPRSAPQAAGRTSTQAPAAAAATGPAAGEEALVRPLLGEPGVGPSTAERLAARGLHRVIDALYFLPRRWDDLRELTPVGKLQAGVVQSTVALIERSRIVWARRRFLEATARGEDGAMLTLRWFVFNGGMAKRLQPGARFLITGSPLSFRGALQLVHPELVELMPARSGEAPGEGAATPAAAETGRVRVRYPDVEGVPPRTLERLCRRLCERYADEVPDGVPAVILHKLSLPALPAALKALHLLPADLPASQLALLNQGLAPPQRRLIFEELFFLQLGLCLRRRRAQVESAQPVPSTPGSLDRLRAVLPFRPTGAQERAIEAIRRDLAQPHPMQRLLHGDVGSGKTLVAYAACELVMAAGRQASIMAPTEILAEQHKKTLGAWARDCGRKLALLTATTPKSGRKTTLAQLQAGRFDDVWRIAEESGQPLDRESILAMLAAGYLDVVVGTHALLAERVEFKDLGLVVIDEQHRFGVAQRAALRKKGQQPHLLVMTATPIPRTLALTLYGDLEVTQLDELPPGRTPPVTRVLGGATGEARAVLAVQRAVAQGRQVYWVCPLIEDSDKIDLQSATTRYQALVAALPGLRVALVHGRLPIDERDEVMARFRAGEIDVLVATTVIEVGVDVPNASLMVIEGAERFGLAQLHQLRGRIGRGAGPSACLLLHPSGESGPGSDEPDEEAPPQEQAAPAARAARRRTSAKAAPKDSDEASELAKLGPQSGTRARLQVLARTSCGFRIAEADLRIRGPGEVLGTRQAGLPPLRYADLLRDIDLLQIARREAASLLQRDPDLRLPEHQKTQRVLLERWSAADLTLE
jgi:ATP-dependent DNA helicase RecG